MTATARLQALAATAPKSYKDFQKFPIKRELRAKPGAGIKFCLDVLETLGYTFMWEKSQKGFGISTVSVWWNPEIQAAAIFEENLDLRSKFVVLGFNDESNARMVFSAMKNAGLSFYKLQK